MMDDTIGVMKRLISMWRGIGVCAALVAGGAFAESGTLAPVNSFNGTQRREEVCEFTGKPAVKKDGGKWIITFASKGKCDATVAILNGDGRIIRHLASGVLGANAPYPFQQNSLAQKIEWDGTDNMEKTVPPDALKSCKVRVSLGLKATFERNIGWEPCAPFLGYSGPAKKKHDPTEYMVATGKDGELCVLSYGKTTGGTYQGRVYKDGKYVRSFYPPPAGDLEKLEKMGYPMTETEWGDKVPPATRYGMATVIPPKSKGSLRKMSIEDVTREVWAMIGITDAKRVDSWPAELVQEAVFKKYFDRKMQRMALDGVRDELYIAAKGVYPLTRINGKTGEIDPTWFPKRNFDKVTECYFGPDGYIYAGLGSLGYNEFIIRLDHEGKPAPFTGNGAVPLPQTGKWEGSPHYGMLQGKGIYGGRVCPSAFRKAADEIKVLWTGGIGHSNVHERGLHVSVRGDIVAGVQTPFGGEWALKRGIPERAVILHKKTKIPKAWMSYVAVWDNAGNILTLNAVGDTLNGHGVAIDRDRNVYATLGQAILEGQKPWIGLPGGPPKKGSMTWGGYGGLFKYRGGVPFPRAQVFYSKTSTEGSVILVGRRGCSIEPEDGALLWGYPGVSGQTTGPCTCHNLRYDMDGFARHWLPANYLYSIMVVDANANIVARLGRYGNVDDSDTDIKEGRDGLRFVWPRAVSVSDTALYVSDHNARRILKAALAYQKEETIPLP